MKIVALQVENFKRLSAVNIKPDGNLVQITGKNGAGKTSVLDSIWVALAGATHIQTVPIRQGADKAHIRLDLGEVVVTRTFSKKENGFTTAIKVENKEGFAARGPQAILDGFMSALTFDPLAFTRYDAKRQFDELRKFVPDVDFAAIELANKADYQKRTDLNRDAKQARAAASQIEVPDFITDQTAEVDEAALTDALAGTGSHNADIETRRARREQAAETIIRNGESMTKIAVETDGLIEASQKRAQKAVDDIKREIDRLEARVIAVGVEAGTEQANISVKSTGAIEGLRAANKSLRAALDDAEPLPEPVDVSAITAQIGTARQINQGIRQRALRDRQADNAAAQETQAKALTDAMEARDRAKQKAIAAAILPVPGLGFGDGLVTLNGLPFDQASDAEQLRASIAIAMASNSKLRVIRVRDGSLLDEDAMKLLAEMTDASDYQVWIERVDSSASVGFVLEDGHIASTPASRVTEGALL